MSGIRNGVASQILAEEQRAIYTHCYGHALNLAVGNTMKGSKVCCEALETAFEISKLIKFSPKRNAAFNKINSETVTDDCHSIGIRKFCPTRWTVRGESIMSIIQNYNVLKELWEQCLETRLDPDVKGRIIGVKTQMSHFKFLFGLQLCGRILMITDNLSKTLQTKSMSAAEGQALAMLTVKTLEKMRNEGDFKLFFQHLEILRSHTDTEEPSLPRRKRVPSWMEIGEGSGSHSTSIEEHYRVQYYEALDLAVSSIKDRFDQPGYAKYKTVEELMLKAANSKDYSAELREVVQLYKDDFNEIELSTQLQIFGAKFATDSEAHSVTLKEAIHFLKGLAEGQREFFNQIFRLAQLIIVMPSTNASSERSFSTMKRVKTYLRSSMGQGRLNHLMILNIYKEFLDSLDLTETADEFVQGSDHRIQVFGKFR
jgi:hypothetical protein